MSPEHLQASASRFGILESLCTCERASLWEEALLGLRRLLPPQSGRLPQKASVLGRGDFDGLPCPNSVTYNAAISACGRARQWMQAFKLLQDMKRRMLQPDVISYGAAVISLEGAPSSDRPTAEHVFGELRSRGLELSLEACHATISASDVQWQKAAWLLGEISRADLAPGLIGFNAVIDVYRNSGRATLALETLQRLEEQPGIQPDVHSYASAIDACSSMTTAAASFMVLAAELPRLCGRLRATAMLTLRPDSLS
eukprot:TRINITY_DN79912_c0_g1_i1.p1 TRINITY_DN79912_c0_g1~~TRINITY_DN79912_c0_g1_i1.p1  ORF type:complete len:267 (-),score=54.77 TRINITY_DN79912_c0_g1_i1:32-799(-)